MNENSSFVIHKKYIDILNFATKFADGFNKGDIISIQEKVDGSNASFQYFPEDDKLHSFSRKQILTPTMTLDGFYEYVNNLDIDAYKKYKDYRFFGEWNLRHIIKYKSEEIKVFHCFDIYDTINQNWLSWLEVKRICNEIGIKTVPEFYYGEFTSWDDILPYIGKTEFGLNGGEGIVIKNQTRLNDPNNRLPFIVKLVASDYREKSMHSPKEPLSPDELAKREYMQELAKSIVTYNRVEKCLFKLAVEDNIIPRDWDESHMSIIAKNLTRKVYNDCIKEEEDTVKKIENFGKLCNSITMGYVKDMLAQGKNFAE